MPELFSELRRRGRRVYLVSGGLTQLIEPVAARVGVPNNDIFAIALQFDADTGAYVDFDRDAPTAATGGKPRVMDIVRERHQTAEDKAAGRSSVVMIGDGVTDCEAAAVADVVVGFGANVVREPVAEAVDWMAMSAQEMLDELAVDTTDF
jgi:phosphoserine phosphatase